MNGFEPAGVQEIINKQEENFRDREDRKRDDAGVPHTDDMSCVPDVRERR